MNAAVAAAATCRPAPSTTVRLRVRDSNASRDILVSGDSSVTGRAGTTDVGIRVADALAIRARLTLWTHNAITGARSARTADWVATLIGATSLARGQALVGDAFLS